ncbi:hypothetical protein [Vibrio phage YC]|uniref:Uncharacterized protein n=1 Tax=Vibrio phage YC TaxID=2267403 RepID=A0A384ZSE5_9CAUD|nr:guanylate kinase [Vibrio phage YC]AXC34545.1 hypothetical protein [Vibrio phage YC]
MTSSFVVVKGGSGSGKGTRVVQVLKFLQTKFKSEPAMVEHKGKPWKLGTVFPKQKILFVGDLVTSSKSGLTSWNSMDRVHSTFGTSKAVPDLLLPYVRNGYTIACEGEAMMRSNRWRPKGINEIYGVDRFFIQYFHYSHNRDAYDQRIIGRSGKKSGDGGWVREEAYHVEWPDNHKEMVDLGHEIHLHNAKHGHHSGKPFLEEITYTSGSMIMKAPVEQELAIWGVRFLIFVGLKDLTSQFNDYVIKKPMLRDIYGNDPLKKTNRLF